MNDPPPVGVRRILYFGDPMCSWCYGFAPALREIAAAFGDKAPIHVVLGGLRLGSTEPMDDAVKEKMRGHWQRVRNVTGQPFDFSFFDRDDFVYDTEPACRAVITARALAPERTLSYFYAVQDAFYRENLDTTDGEVLARLADSTGIMSARFSAAFASEEITLATGADFRLTRLLGVNEFPSLVLQEDTRYAYLTAGYRPYSELAPVLTKWLQTENHSQGGSEIGR